VAIIDGEPTEVTGYDLTPKGIRSFLELDRPVYAETAAWGHFGRGFTWR
jgi:S-adenosylmethionine synthetase